MKKVLLINSNMVQVPYQVPPVGICLQAAALEDAYTVRVYDALPDGGAGLAAELAAFAPDYVGLGIRNIDDVVVGGSFFIGAIRDQIASPLRAMTRAPIILGGSGFTIFPAELMEVLDADFGVVGEGELSLPALLRTLDAGADASSVPGVICRDPSAPAAPRGEYMDLGTVRPADIDRRIDYAPYDGRGSYPIQTKRGCVHRCLYCSYPQLEGRRFRVRPPSAVVDELEAVRQRLGSVRFEFVDSTFNDPPGHAEAICREIIRRGIRPVLRTMGVNPVGVTRELLELMQEAGFAQIDCTPDSASPGMLHRLQKNFSRDQLESAARLIRHQGMPTMWFFLLGGPGETRETIDETFAFIDAFVCEDDMAHISEGLRIYPHTDLHTIAIEEGVVAADASLLEPRFYFSPALGRAGLAQCVEQAIADRPNCVRSVDSSPPPAMMKAAIQLRTAEEVDEPMFRTLLRLKRSPELWGG